MIIIYLWLIFSFMLMIEIMQHIENKISFKQMIGLTFICVLAGPSFGIVSVCEGLLDIIFPEGWDDT